MGGQGHNVAPWPVAHQTAAVLLRRPYTAASHMGSLRLSLLSPGSALTPAAAAVPTAPDACGVGHPAVQ